MKTFLLLTVVALFTGCAVTNPICLFNCGDEQTIQKAVETR